MKPRQQVSERDNVPLFHPCERGSQDLQTELSQNATSKSKSSKSPRGKSKCNKRIPWAVYRFSYFETHCHLPSGFGWIEYTTKFSEARRVWKPNPGSIAKCLTSNNHPMLQRMCMGRKLEICKMRKKGGESTCSTQQRSSGLCFFFVILVWHLLNLFIGFQWLVKRFLLRMRGVCAKGFLLRKRVV